MRNEPEEHSQQKKSGRNTVHSRDLEMIVQREMGGEEVLSGDQK